MGKTGAGRIQEHRPRRMPISRQQVMELLIQGRLSKSIKKRAEATEQFISGRERDLLHTDLAKPIRETRNHRTVFAYAGDEALSVNRETFALQGVRERLNALMGRVARVRTYGSNPHSFIGELKEIDLQRNVVMFWCAAQNSNIHVSVAGGDAFVLSKPEGFSNSEAEVLNSYGWTFDPSRDVRVVDGKVDINAATVEVGASYKVYLIEDRRSGHSARELNKGRPVIFAANQANVAGEFECSDPKKKKIGTDKRTLVFMKIDKT